MPPVEFLCAMRRSDRDSSGSRAVKRGQAADQMFNMKAHGRRFLLPKYFDLVAEPRLLLLLLVLASLVATLLAFDFQPQMTLTMFSAILAKSTTMNASAFGLDGVATTDDTAAFQSTTDVYQRWSKMFDMYATAASTGLRATDNLGQSHSGNHNNNSSWSWWTAYGCSFTKGFDEVPHACGRCNQAFGAVTSLDAGKFGTYRTGVPLPEGGNLGERWRPWRVQLPGTGFFRWSLQAQCDASAAWSMVVWVWHGWAGQFFCFWSDGAAQQFCRIAISACETCKTTKACRCWTIVFNAGAWQATSRWTEDGCHGWSATNFTLSWFSWEQLWFWQQFLQWILDRGSAKVAVLATLQMLERPRPKPPQRGHWKGLDPILFGLGYQTWFFVQEPQTLNLWDKGQLLP